MMDILTNIVWLAVCIYHEARGEPEPGQIAVGHVIMNRVAAENVGVREVVLRPWQFSWANGGARPPISDYAALVDCFRSAVRCLDERMAGCTLKGADHYHADYVAPSWATKMPLVAQIGHHLFYRSKK